MEEKLKLIYEYYGGDMVIDLEEFKFEVIRWRYCWFIRELIDFFLQMLVEILDVVNFVFYLVIYVVIKMFLMYFVLVCVVECSFSLMKRLKMLL